MWFLWRNEKHKSADQGSRLDPRGERIIIVFVVAAAADAFVSLLWRFFHFLGFRLEFPTFLVAMDLCARCSRFLCASIARMKQKALEMRLTLAQLSTFTTFAV
jgi:hypothetical protein